GAFAESEGAQAVIEALGAQFERDLGGSDIRGDLDYSSQVEPSVTTVVVDRAPADGVGAVLAVDLLMRRNYPVGQRDRGEQPFHRRARLEGVLHCGVVQSLAHAGAVGGDAGQREHLTAA